MATPAPAPIDAKAFWEAVRAGIEKARDPVKAMIADIKKAQEEEEKAAAKRAELNSRYFSGLTAGITKVTGILTAGQTALTNFGSQLAQFVRLANPAAIIRFQRAVDNLGATIGQVITPVFERVTVMVQRLGNAIASLSPTAQRLIGGLAGGAGLGAVLGAMAVAAKVLIASLGPIPIIVGLLASGFAGVAGTLSSTKALGDAFSRVLGALGTVFEVLAAIAVPAVTFVMDILVDLLEELADGLQYVGKVIRDVLETLGLVDAANYNSNAKPAVEAVRRAQIGDVSSFANRAYTSAYGGATTDIPKQSLEELKGIRKGVDSLKESIEQRLGIEKGFLPFMPALNPNEVGSDGATNFERGAIRLYRMETEAGNWIIDRLGALLD